MPTFKDANGREWTVRANVGIIKDVREKLKINLAAIDGSTFDRLQDDTELLVNTLWIICQSEAEKSHITESQFGEALVGDPIDDACNALLEAVGNFFPKRKRELMNLLAKKKSAIRDLQFEKAMSRLTDPKMDQDLQEALEKNLDASFEKALTQLKSATDSPDSSESSPTL